MDGIRRYLDHAATSFPKHPQVIEAMRLFAEGTGASPGRGAYAEAISAGRQLSDCRARLARLACGSRDGGSEGALPADHVVFTLNASDALNFAIKGVTAGPIRAGNSVRLITTAMDHNSVLRPFNALAAAWPNVSMTVIDVDASGIVDLKAMQMALDDSSDDAETNASLTLLAVSHGSNVTGSVQPIDAIGAMAKAAGAIFLLDAAQTFGHRTVDMTACNIDLLAVPGHKGLLGPLGTGALMIQPALVAAMEPLREGGTGSVSEHEFQPDFMPDKFEPGSHNAMGLAGLNASLAWMETRGIPSIHAEHRRLIDRFAEKSAAARAHGLVIHGPPLDQDRCAVFSMTIPGLDPHELAVVLEEQFGLLTRAGLHCAPLAHRAMGTFDAGGSTRASFGITTTDDDVDALAAALEEIAKSMNADATRATSAPIPETHSA